MSTTILSIKQMSDASVDPGANVIFDTSSPHPAEIDYDETTGTITFNEIGVYSVKWWIATKTTLHGAIDFELTSSQGDLMPSCSPLKTGQLSGFGAINVTEVGTTLSLINRSLNNVVLSSRAKTRAYLLITTIESAGHSGIGSIIPFSTGERPLMLMSDENGNRSMVSMLGFGSGGEYSAPNDPIEFFVSRGERYYAFSIPTAGTISALSASFILEDLDPETDNSITAQLYYSLTFDNTFMPVPGATVELGTISGDDPFGKVLNGIVTGINIPIPAQTNLLLIFYNKTVSQESSLVRGVMQGGLLIV